MVIIPAVNSARHLASLCHLCQLAYAVWAGSVSSPGRWVTPLPQGLTKDGALAMRNPTDEIVAALEAD